MTSKTRLFKELKEARHLASPPALLAAHLSPQLQSEKETEFQLVPDETNIYRWTAILQARVAEVPHAGFADWFLPGALRHALRGRRLPAVAGGATAVPT